MVGVPPEQSLLHGTILQPIRAPVIPAPTRQMVLWLERGSVWGNLPLWELRGVCVCVCVISCKMLPKLFVCEGDAQLHSEPQP